MSKRSTIILPSSAFFASIYLCLGLYRRADEENIGEVVLGLVFGEKYQRILLLYILIQNLK